MCISLFSFPFFLFLSPFLSFFIFDDRNECNKKFLLMIIKERKKEKKEKEKKRNFGKGSERRKERRNEGRWRGKEGNEYIRNIFCLKNDFIFIFIFIFILIRERSFILFIIIVSDMNKKRKWKELLFFSFLKWVELFYLSLALSFH